MLQMMSVIAELERNLLADRVREGIEASKKRGVAIGRPKVPQEKLDIAVRMYKSGDYSIKKIIETNQISTGTFYREINRLKLKKVKQKKRTTNVIYRQLFVFLPLFSVRMFQ